MLEIRWGEAVGSRTVAYSSAVQLHARQRHPVVEPTFSRHGEAFFQGSLVD